MSIFDPERKFCIWGRRFESLPCSFLVRGEIRRMAGYTLCTVDLRCAKCKQPELTGSVTVDCVVDVGLGVNSWVDRILYAYTRRRH